MRTVTLGRTVGRLGGGSAGFQVRMAVLWTILGLSTGVFAQENQLAEGVAMSLATTRAVITKPNPVTNLTATAVSSTAIKVSWGLNYTGASRETSINVLKWNGSGWVNIATLAPGATQYTDTAVLAGSTVYYYIITVNSAGQGVPGNYVYATTPAAITRPNPVTNLTATAVSSTAIKVSWGLNSSGASRETSINVLKWNPSSGWVNIATLAAGVTAYTDPAVAAGSTAFYYVITVNSAGVGVPANYTYATTPAVSNAGPTYDGTTPAPGVTNTNAGIPVNPPVTSTTANRSRAAYDNVVNQFAVANNPRYQKRNINGVAATFCNIFLWDVTRAMNAEIPHWVNMTTGAPTAAGSGTELGANATADWMASFGTKYGWRQVSAQQAQNNANLGQPSVVLYRNQSGEGHCQVVRPGTYSSTRGAYIAQAGFINTNFGYVRDFLPANAGETYWSHN